VATARGLLISPSANPCVGWWWSLKYQVGDKYLSTVSIDYKLACCFAKSRMRYDLIERLVLSLEVVGIWCCLGEKKTLELLRNPYDGGKKKRRREDGYL